MSRPAGPAALVTVILATRRPAFLPAAVRMIRAQGCAPVELIVVLHGHPAGGLPDPQRAAVADADRAIEAPASWSIDECLDAGIDAARGEILAKVDDDDLYGPGSLGEAVAALAAGKGDVIGKTEIYVHLVAERQLVLWRPGASGCEQDYVMGGTLVFPRSLGIPFRVPASEEPQVPGFLQRCRAAGHSVYATSRRHYVHRRFPQPEHHMWRPDSGLFGREGVVVRRDVGDDADGLLRLVG